MRFSNFFAGLAVAAAMLLTGAAAEAQKIPNPPPGLTKKVPDCPRNMRLSTAAATGEPVCVPDNPHAKPRWASP